MHVSVADHAVFENPNLTGRERLQDYNLWLRLAHRGARIRVIPEELLDYTPGPNNLSGQFSRMLRSELNNVEKIRVDCGLSDQLVRDKQATIYAEWGEALFHVRSLRDARECFWQVLVRRPSARTLIQWIAAFMPPAVLNVRRAMASRVNRSAAACPAMTDTH